MFIHFKRCLFIDLRAKRSQSFISKIGYRSSSVIGRRRLRTSDDNDLEHVMNTESSLETGPFATFRPPQDFIIYLNFSFISINKRRRVIKTKEN